MSQMARLIPGLIIPYKSGTWRTPLKVLSSRVKRFYTATRPSPNIQESQRSPQRETHLSEANPNVLSLVAFLPYASVLLH